MTQQMRRLIRVSQIRAQLERKRAERDAIIDAAVDEITEGHPSVDMDLVAKVTAQIDALLEELQLLIPAQRQP